MSDIFICKHCGKEMNIKQFGRHLLKFHNQKYEDYIKNNLEDFKHLGWNLCSQCKNLFRGRSDKCGVCFTKSHNLKFDQQIMCHLCNTHIHSKVISIHLKTYHGVEFLEYVAEHLEDFRKMNWDKCCICGNVTKRRGHKHNPTCSYECMGKLRETEYKGRKGHSFTDEEKKKISIGNIGKIGLKGNLNPACRTEVRNKISQTRIKRGVAAGENNPMFGKTHTPETIQKIFAHRPMNKLEKMIADQLDAHNIPYHFQFFITENNLCKSYDFKIKGKPLIIETDGDFWHGNPAQKNHYEKASEIRENDALKDEMAARRGYTVIRLWERDIKKDPSIVLKYVLN